MGFIKNKIVIQVNGWERKMGLHRVAVEYSRKARGCAGEVVGIILIR